MSFVFPPWRGLDLSSVINRKMLIEERLAEGDFSPSLYGGILEAGQAEIEAIKSIAIISTFYGSDESRLNSVRAAHSFLCKTSPMPRYIMVEGVDEGNKALSWPSFVDHIKVPITKASREIWLKESLLDIGIIEALSDPGVTSILFLDSDTSFCSKDWAIWVLEALTQYDVIRPASLIYSTAFEGKEGKVIGQKGIEDLQVDTHFSIGLSRQAIELIGGRLPKNQNRFADIDLITKLGMYNLSYGTAEQTIFHVGHRRALPNKFYSKYKSKAGTPFNDSLAIDWDPAVPVWRDTEEASLALSIIDSGVRVHQ